MSAYLGIDIAKASFTVALRQPKHSAVATAEFANTPLGFDQLWRWLAARQVTSVHACLEATGRYGMALATFLYDHDQPVSVVNPAQTKAFAKALALRTKTDRVDAKLLALFVQHLQPYRWSPPDPARSRLQQLTRHRQVLLAAQQADRNRLQAGAVEPVLQTFLQQRLALYAEQLVLLQAEIDAHIDAHAALKRQHQLLDSIPGIGPVSAAALLGELPDIRRFQRASQLVAYAGIDPSEHVSGSSVHKPTKISKQGNARLRSALYFPGVSGMSRCRFYRSLVERLEAKRHCPMSIIVAVMRKQLHLVFGVLKHDCPFDPHYLEKKARAVA